MIPISRRELVQRLAAAIAVSVAGDRAQAASVGQPVPVPRGVATKRPERISFEQYLRESAVPREMIDKFFKVAAGFNLILNLAMFWGMTFPPGH